MENYLERSNLRYAVIGGGSWATALVKLMLNNCSEIVWYIRNSEVIDSIIKTGHNPSYLQGVKFDTSVITLSDDINKVVENADVILFCVPSAYFLAEVSCIRSLKDKFVISAIKGIIPGDNITIAEYFHRVHKIPFSRIGVVSGPCHAEEVALERLSYLTLSSKNKETAKSLCKMLSCNYIRTIPGTDIFGVEYAAVLKNIYAIAAGVAISLGYGDNFMAVLVTNAFHEMRRFLHVAHPDSERATTKSAYLGDLLVTCYSQFSRNRTFGTMIGKGYPVKSALLETKMVAEGYFGTKCIYELNREFKADMPVADAMFRILYRNENVSFVMRELSDKLE
ncbi:MAG: NAD(P)-binding domain-containing protein [Bacteroidales bacterium]|nr:NAD(P)-binding domain-containing protein [Bacteroidales bacterium]